MEIIPDEWDSLAKEFGVTMPKPKNPRVLSPYDSFIEDSALRHNVDPDFIRGVIGQESSWEPKALSHKGASGLMQLMPATARRMGVTDIYDPQQNIEGGTKYLRFLLDRYKGDIPKTLAGYNAGEGAVDKYQGVPPYRETRDYVQKIGSKYKGSGYHPQTANKITSSTDFDALSKEFLGDTPETDFNGLSEMFGLTAPITESQPVPESPDTLQAQMTSALDPLSPRAAVLTTSQEQNGIFGNADGFLPVEFKRDGYNGTLWVNKAKARKLKLRTPQDIEQFITNNPDAMTRLIGKAANVGGETAGGMAVKTTAPNGTEVSSSVVLSPETVEEQINIDQQAFPGSTSQIVPTDDVVAERLRILETLGKPAIERPEMYGERENDYREYLKYGGLTDSNENRAEYNRLMQESVDNANRENQKDIAKANAESAQVQRKVKQPSDVSNTQVETPREFGKATDELDRVAKVIRSDKSDPREAAIDALVQAGYNITPQEAAKYVDSLKTPLGSEYQPGVGIQITFGNIADIKGRDEVIAQIRMEQAQSRPGLVTPKDLHVGKDWVKEDADWLNSNAGNALIAVNPLFAALDKQQRDNIASSAIGGIMGSGARTWNALAGIARPFNSDLSETLREFARPSEGLERQTGDGGIVSTVAKIAGGAPGDLSRLYLLTRIPGGLATKGLSKAGMTGAGANWLGGLAGSSIGFSLDSGLQSAGRQESLDQVSKQFQKGALIGSIFGVAPIIGGGVMRYGVGSAVKSPVARKVAEETGTVGAIALGTDQIEKAYGASDEEAFHAAIVNSLFHLGGVAAQSLKGKTIRVKSSDGKEATVGVTPEGQVKLLKGETGKADAEMYIDVEPNAQGVYTAKGDTTPAETVRVGNRGNRVETSPEPAQLAENNPQRIETPDPAAVQKAGIDTRVRKVADALKGKDFTTIDALAKTTRMSKTNIEDAVMTLYGARQVELLPGNQVRLIDSAELTKQTDLYERAKTYGQENVARPTSVSQPPAPTNAAVDVPQAKAETSAKVNLETSESRPPVITPEQQAEAQQSVGIATQISPEQSARDAGTVTKDGVTYTRQTELKEYPSGRTGKVKFAENISPDFTYRLIPADKLQPAHINGTPNYNHFLPEAQPKARTDKASVKAADKIAGNINFEEVGESPNAYAGAPVINARGEVIQGNNRAAGIKLAYGQNDNYKRQLEANAERFGFTPEQIASVDKPVLVREVAAEDQDAITLGNYDDLDTTSGGSRRIEPVKIAGRVPHEDKAKILSDVFLNASEDKSLTDLIRDNQGVVKNHLTPYLTETQQQSMVENGRLTPKAVEDIKDTFTHFLFSGGAHNLPELFDGLPDKAQKGLTQALPHIFSVPSDKTLVTETQNAIQAANTFGELQEADPNLVWEQWAAQPDMLTGGMAPQEIFTPTEMAIARKLHEAKRQSDIKGLFADYARLINGKEADLFGEATPGISKAEAVKEIFNVEHQEREIPQAANTRSESRTDEGTRLDAEENRSAASEAGTKSADPAESSDEVSAAKSELKTVDDLSPLEKSTIRRDIAPKEHQGKAKLPSEVARSYGLPESELAKLTPLGEVGKFGQTSHIIKKALSSEEADELYNDFARIFAPSELRDTDPEFPEMVDRGGQAANIVDAIAQDMGFPRSSHMDADAWGQFLDKHGLRLGDEAINTILSALDHQQAWHRNIIRFLSDPSLEPVYSKVEEIGNRFGYEPLANAHWGVVKPEGFDANAPAFDLKGEKELKKLITIVGDKYGRQAVGDVGPLSTQTIKETFVLAVRRTAQEELANRTGTSPQRTANPQDTSQVSQKEQADKRPRNAPQLSVPAIKEPPSARDATAKSAEVASIENFQDYGEKIGGAKKDLYQFLDRAADPEALKTQPLSKAFPRPDFGQLIKDNAITLEAAKFLAFVYDQIPAKPRRAYRVDRWAKQVQGVIDTFRQAFESKGDHVFMNTFVNKATALLKNAYDIHSAWLDVTGFPENARSMQGYDIKRFDNTSTTWRDKAQDKTIYSIVKDGRILGDYETATAAAEALLQRLDEPNKTTFDLYQDRTTKDYFIGKKGAKGVVRLAEGFKTLEEARQHRKDNADILEKAWEAKKYRQGIERKDGGEEIREAKDWRNGKDIASTKEFGDAFGFKGVEFGNWMKQGSSKNERQDAINSAYDGLMDLAELIGVPPQALSLNGELSLALGARGSGQASAHYEPTKIVINLTKTRGKGALAHEWWHGLDNYFSRMRGEKGGMVTEYPRVRMVKDSGVFVADPRVREQVLDAYKGVVDAIKSTNMAKRSDNMDAARSSGYWSTVPEMTARAFENYVIDRLGEKGQRNDYLANFRDMGDWAKTGLDPDAFPYPTKEEAPKINEAFDNFFNVLEHKITDTGNVALYSKTKPTPGQVDLWGNATAMHSLQQQLFDIEQKVEQTKRDSIVPEKTVNYLRELRESNNKKVSHHAEALTQLAYDAFNKDIASVVEDAADALDLYSRSLSTGIKVRRLIAQPSLGETINLSDRAKTFAKAMERGEFETVLNNALGNDTLFMTAWHERPAFYSQVERTIEQKMPNRATAEQIKGILKDAKKEGQTLFTRPGEIEATGRTKRKLSQESEHLKKELDALTANALEKGFDKIAERAKFTRLGNSPVMGLNREGLMVMSTAMGNSTWTGATIPKAASVERLRNRIANMYHYAVNTGNKRMEKAMGKALMLSHSLTDPETGSLAMAIDIPAFPTLSKASIEEEHSHVGDLKARHRYNIVDAPDRFIKARPADYRTALQSIKELNYPKHLQHAEFTGKLKRHDAHEELGISQDAVDEFRDIYDLQLLQAGVTATDYLDFFGSISNANARRAEQYARQFEKTSRTNKPETGSDNSTLSESRGRNGRRSGSESPQNPAREQSRSNEPELQLRRVPKTAEIDARSTSDLTKELNRFAEANGSNDTLSPRDTRFIEKRASGQEADDLKNDTLFAKSWGTVNINGKRYDLGTKTKEVAVDLLNTPRAIKASSDLSAAGRQGLISAVNHPVIATKAFIKQLTMLPPKAGARAYERFKRDLNLHPYIELAEASGLHLTSMGDDAISHREEAFMSRLLGNDRYFTNDKIETLRKGLTFGVRASERAYVTFLDYLRINQFATLARQLHQYNVRKGRPDEQEQYTALASWINNATGRGDLGKFNDAAPILNATFFSPRYWMSRLQVINPEYYAKLPRGVKKLAIKEMLTFIGAVAGLLALLKAAGADVETEDENNPDLIKLRLGNYSYDFTAGTIGHFRYIARMIMALAGEDKRDPLDTMMYLTGRYGRAKLAPIPAGVVNTVQGQNYIGAPTSAKEELFGLFTPIMADNFREAIKAEGTVGALKTAPEFFGISTTRYAKPEEYQKKAEAESKRTDISDKEKGRRIKLWNKLAKRSARYQKR